MNQWEKFNLRLQDQTNKLARKMAPKRDYKLLTNVEIEWLHEAESRALTEDDALRHEALLDELHNRLVRLSPSQMKHYTMRIHEKRGADEISREFKINRATVFRRWNMIIRVLSRP